MNMVIRARFFELNSCSETDIHFPSHRFRHRTQLSRPIYIYKDEESSAQQLSCSPEIRLPSADRKYKWPTICLMDIILKIIQKQTCATTRLYLNKRRQYSICKTSECVYREWKAASNNAHGASEIQFWMLSTYKEKNQSWCILKTNIR